MVFNTLYSFNLKLIKKNINNHLLCALEVKSSKRKLPERIANMTMKKMDCEWEDGIPGPDLSVETGRAWFSIRLSIIERPEFTTEPIAAHKASASCLQSMIAHKTID